MILVELGRIVAVGWKIFGSPNSLIIEISPFIYTYCICVYIYIYIYLAQLDTFCQEGDVFKSPAAQPFMKDWMRHAERWARWARWVRWVRRGEWSLMAKRTWRRVKLQSHEDRTRKIQQKIPSHPLISQQNPWRSAKSTEKSRRCSENPSEKHESTGRGGFQQCSPGRNGGDGSFTGPIYFERILTQMLHGVGIFAEKLLYV